MGHPDEGQIRAFMDGETEGLEPKLESHIRECPRCAALVREQEDTLAVLSESLSLLDTPPPLRRARAGIPLPSRPRRPWIFSRRDLPKAASIAILLTAGAAAALPNSPIHQWVARAWEAVPGESHPETLPPPPSPESGATRRDGEMAGASLVVKEGGLTIRIDGMQEGAEILVLLVGGDQAGLFAETGTRFRTESGLMEARDPPGSVTVEIPRTGQMVELLVEGVLFLRQRGGEFQIPGPVKERTPTEIRFGLSTPGGAGSPPQQERR